MRRTISSGNGDPQTMCAVKTQSAGDHLSVCARVLLPFSSTVARDKTQSKSSSRDLLMRRSTPPTCPSLRALSRRHIAVAHRFRQRLTSSILPRLFNHVLPCATSMCLTSGSPILEYPLPCEGPLLSKSPITVNSSSSTVLMNSRSKTFKVKFAMRYAQS